MPRNLLAVLFALLVVVGCAGPEPVDPVTGYKIFRDCKNCPYMTVVPSVSFTMGRQTGSSDEKPLHHVTISKPFAVGQYEVTFEEWALCVAEGGCGGYSPEDERWGRERRPVINVSWEDSQSFVAWLSEKTGRNYRLLSESEWEYIAKEDNAEQSASFPSKYTANYFYWYGSSACCEPLLTKLVGQYPPRNQFELYDLFGNVEEWVQDCWHDSYSGAPTTGAAWEKGADCDHRVIRGGSSHSIRTQLYPAFRNHVAKSTRKKTIGFRVAADLY